MLAFDIKGFNPGRRCGQDRKQFGFGSLARRRWRQCREAYFVCLSLSSLSIWWLVWWLVLYVLLHMYFWEWFIFNFPNFCGSSLIMFFVPSNRASENPSVQRTISDGKYHTSTTLHLTALPALVLDHFSSSEWLNQCCRQTISIFSRIRIFSLWFITVQIAKSSVTS